MRKLNLVHLARSAASFSCAASLWACSDSSGVSSTFVVDPPRAGAGGVIADGGGSVPSDAGAADSGPKTFALSVSVVGLEGAGLTLQNNGGDDLAITASEGAKPVIASFAKQLSSGAPFSISIKKQPQAPAQQCRVSGGVGTVASGPVASILVNCSNQFVIGGKVTGLSGKDLVLQNNYGDPLTINASGGFAFPVLAAKGDAFSVTVKANPTSPWQTCVVAPGTGTGSAVADVSSVAIACNTDKHYVSGDVVGLRGSGVVIQNNGADDLALVATAQRFIFPIKVASGERFAVTVKAQPSGPSQQCTLSAGVGVMAGADVADAKLVCSTSKFRIGGSVRSLAGRGLILQDNAGDDLTLSASASGDFFFATPVESGSSYAVTIKQQPQAPEQRCSLRDASGTVGAADVRTVVVDCGGVIANPSGTETTSMHTPNGSFHDTVTSDPKTGKVYVFPSYDAVSVVIEYPDLASFQRDQGARKISLEVPYEGTYHVVLDGHLYYAAAGSNVLIRAEAGTGRLVAKAELSGAGYSNQSCYNWGGYSDINFYIDTDLSLHVVYAEPGGNMRIVAIDKNTLASGTPVELPRRKGETGWGFLANSIFYFGESYDQASFGGAFSIVDGSAVTLPQPLSFTPQADYITSVFWDPSSKNLFENTSGNIVIYPNVF
jgi:hypothetical protein